ncbi:hypothetical protein Lser_V15G29206 [Lactuca serriola]
MGVELMKEYVGIAMTGCHRSASRHPLLAFMILVLIWIYRSFPSLFALLVDASPVIVCTTVLLGILLFFGQSNAPEIQKEEKPYHNKIHNLKFGVMGDTELDWRGERQRPRRREKASRKRTRVVHRVNINDNHHMGSSIDKKFIQEAKSGVGNRKEIFVLVKPLEAKDCAHRNEDDRGWETGSELIESTSPTSSMADFSMLEELHPIHDYPKVSQHAHMSNITTDAESSNSEGNDQGDIQVKDDQMKKEEDQKNLMHPFDLPYNPSRQESDPVDSAPLKPNNQLSHQHESFEKVPSTLMASNQGKQGNHLGPQFVPEPETSDATNYSSMHREMDELSDSKVSSTPDKKSVGFLLTEDVPSREAADSNSKEGFHAESVGSSHYEDDPPRESDLISVKEGHYEDDSASIKESSFPESVGSSHYKDDPSQEADLTSVKEGFYSQSVGSSHYEDETSRESDLTSEKEGYHEDDSASIKKGSYQESVGLSHYEDELFRESNLSSLKEGYHEDDSASIKKGSYPESVGSSHYEDEPFRKSNSISVKESQYEDDSASIKKGSYPDSVVSSHYEDEPSRESNLTSVKEGHYEDDSASIKKGSYLESVVSSHYEDEPSRESNLTSVKEGRDEYDSASIKEGSYPESVDSSPYEDHPSEESDLIPVKEGHYEEDSASMKKGSYPESVGSSHYEDSPSQASADSTSVKEGSYPESVDSSHYEDHPSQESDLIPVKEGHYEDDPASIKRGSYPESVDSSHYEDDPSQEADSTSVKEGFNSQSVASSRYEDDHSREADMMSVKEGYDDDSSSMKDGNYAESVVSVYTDVDPSPEDDTNSVKEGYCVSEISDYVSQLSGSSDDDDTVKLHHDDRPNEVKTSGGNETGYQGKSRSESSSSPISDITGHVDDDEDEYRSTIMPLTSHSENEKIQEHGKETSLNINSATTAEAADSGVHDFESDYDQKQDDQSSKSEHDDSDSSVHDSESDSKVSKPNEGILPQRLSQVQQGLTSWFRWKA